MITMADRIDAHHHLWRYSKKDYGWIGPGMDALARDFLPGDLEKELRASGIDGCVAVQVRQTTEETEWLLQLASESNLICGVGGWAPIASKEFAGVLEKWADREKLKGLRDIIKNEGDDDFINRQEFHTGNA